MERKFRKFLVCWVKTMGRKLYHLLKNILEREIVIEEVIEEFRTASQARS